MKREEFLKELKDAMQVEKLAEDDSLLDMDEWDSLAMTSTLLAFNTKLDSWIDIQKIRDCNTVAELLDLGNDKYE